MRTTWMLAAVACTAACSTSYLERGAVPVPLTVHAPTPDLKPEQRTLADSDQTPPSPETAAAEAGRVAPPASQTSTSYTIVRVDRPVYFERPTEQAPSGAGGQRNEWPAYGDPGYQPRPQYGYAPPHHRSSFPVHTAIGAGVGAIIGHQSGHRDEGAAVGGAIGLLLDLGSWHR
jgi:hypothetical protein